ncbi:MAG: hypothetical protein JNJ61_08500 [Anaerolineae bacterium]|nr:hypothetical protein [Anaerolineae bacterium]
MTPALRRIIIRIFVIVAYFSTVVLAIAGIQNQALESIVAFFGVCLAIFTSPPIDEWLETLFEERGASAYYVRKRVQEYWKQFIFQSREGENWADATVDNGQRQKPNLIERRLSFEGNSESQTLLQFFETAEKTALDTTCLVIQGGRGSGRTFELLQLANSLISRQDARLILYLNLYTWTAGCKAFDVWLSEAIAHEYNIVSWESQVLIERNHLVLLLDGFDDVHYKYRRHLIRALKKFIGERNAERNEEKNKLNKLLGMRDAIVIATGSVKENEVNEIKSDSTPKQLNTWLLVQHNKELKTELRLQQILSLEPLNEAQVTDRLLEFYGLELGSVLSRSIIEDLRSDTFVLHSLPLIDLQSMLSKEVSPLTSTTNEDKTEIKVWKDLFVKNYIQSRLKKLPSGHQTNDPYFPQSIDLQQLLHLTVKELKENKEENPGGILGQRNLFFLENVDISAKNGKPSHIFRGIVAIVSAVLFLLLYWFVFLISPVEPNNQTLIAGSIILTIFGLLYGWVSCSDSQTIHPKLRWYSTSGLISAILLSPLVGLMFHDASCKIYQHVCLQYESLVYSVFAFLIFLIIGGLDFGRRFMIVSRPNGGRQFLITSSLILSIFWVLFFFMFMLWPRAAAYSLDEADLRAMISNAIPYAVYWGAFLGLLSGIVFCHLLLRHFVMIRYVRTRYKAIGSFEQVFDYLVSIGLMYRLAGGYSFRHKGITDYFNGNSSAGN